MLRFSPEMVPWFAAAKRRSRGLAVRLGGALACAALATGALAQVEGQPAPAAATGLKGLLPAEAPEGLLNTLSTLPESWAQWAESVTTELTKFYSETSDTVDGQRAALQRLKVKLGTIDKALADPQYGSIRGQLRSLHGALSRRIDVMEAVLDTLAGNPAAGKASSVDNAKENLLTAVDVVNSHLDGITGGDNWKKYLQTSDVRTWVTGEGDAAKLAEALKPVLTKAQSAASSTDAAIKEFASNPAIKTYSRDLDRAVATLTRSIAGVNMDEVRNQLKALLEGLDKYEATGTSDSATQVRTAYDKLRDLAADGGDRLTSVLRQYYFNSNLQVTISEGFLNRVLAKTHIEEGGVRDFILGADVYGCQITSTSSKFDLLPSESGANFRINLTGTVTTSTEGYKSSVVIYSQGNHQFTAFKDVHFDGDKFQTSPANMHVYASNAPVDASTRADNVPILGGVAKSIVMNAAIRKRQEAEAIAAQRVTSRVGPEFDNEVDDKFTELNSKVQNKVNDPLKAENLYPDYRSSRSTDYDFSLNSRVMADHELGGGVAPTEAVTDGEMVLRIHESLMNNFFDRLGINGKTMTEDEFRKVLEDKMSKLLSKQVSLNKAKEPTGDEAKNQPRAFMFTEKDPLRAKVVDGQIHLIIRAGFQRDEDKGGNIPPQIVTIPLSLSVEGEEVVVTRGDVSVDPVEAPGNVAEQIARAGVIKKKLETSIQNKRDSRTLKVDRDEGDPINVNVVGFEALDGWLSIKLQ